MDKYISQK